MGGRVVVRGKLVIGPVAAGLDASLVASYGRYRGA